MARPRSEDALAREEKLRELLRSELEEATQEPRWWTSSEILNRLGGGESVKRTQYSLALHKLWMSEEIVRTGNPPKHCKYQLNPNYRPKAAQAACVALHAPLSHPYEAPAFDAGHLCPSPGPCLRAGCTEHSTRELEEAFA